MKMYSADFICNKTGRLKTQHFIGIDEKEVNEVIETYCKDENVSIMKDMKLVDDNFDFNPVDIDMNIKLVSDDFEQSLSDELDEIELDRTRSIAAND